MTAWHENGTQNGVRLLGKLKKKFKKKVKTDLPYLSFYKKKPETHIFFSLYNYWGISPALLAPVVKHDFRMS
jgi:hypothetical protein